MNRNLEQESMHGFILSDLSQYIHENIIVSLSRCVCKSLKEHVIAM